MKKQLIIPILTVILTACSGVKNLRVPETDIPETFSIYMSNDTACLADLKWWEFYSDPALSGLIRKTLEQNKDLLTAASKIEELRLIYGADKAALLPSLSLNAYANNETNNYSGSGTINDTEIGMKVTVGWEANLAGALSWAKKRSASNYKASVEDYRAMQMALIALTAEGYYQMAALENEIQIVERTVETRMESLRMAKIRFEGGLTPETVYQQAIVEYTSAASKLPDLKRRLNATRNALTILMGETPKDTFDLEISRLAPVDVSKLPVGIPSGLVERRPDIRASRLRLDAARAYVGYNYAEQFPSFKIAVTPGFENDELHKFLQSPFSYIIGSVTGPIFDFGKNKKKYEAAKAVYEQSRLQYEKTVIQAFTEVNTAVSDYVQTRESAILKNDLCLAAAKYIQLAQLQYRAGTLNYIEVLDAQRRYFEAQIELNNAIRDEYLALIDLYKALGGGWNPD